MIKFKNIKSDKTTEVEFLSNQLNLLGHAQSIELDLGSQCGGHGFCGKDLITIDLNDMHLYSPVTEKERKHIKQNLLNKGVRLACQCFLEKDTANSAIQCNGINVK